jgi:hypothetical protein
VTHRRRATQCGLSHCGCHPRPAVFRRAVPRFTQDHASPDLRRTGHLLGHGREHPRQLGPLAFKRIVFKFHVYCGDRGPVTGNPTDLLNACSRRGTPHPNRRSSSLHEFGVSIGRARILRLHPLHAAWPDLQSELNDVTNAFFCKRVARRVEDGEHDGVLGEDRGTELTYRSMLCRLHQSP